MTKDEVLRLALDALEKMQNAIYNIGGEHVIDLNFAIEQADVSEDAITAIKAALEAKDEPVAWMCADESLINKGYARFSHVCMGEWKIPVYTTPPQRKPLTDEEIEKMRHLIDWTAHWSYNTFARAIEAAHGIKGEA